MAADAINSYNVDYMCSVDVRQKVNCTDFDIPAF